MSVALPNSLFNIQYDLDINSVRGEEIPSDDQLEFVKRAFSVLKRAIINEVLNHMPSDDEDYLSRLKNPSWIQYFNIKEYQTIFDFNVRGITETLKELTRLSDQILVFTNILVDLRIIMDAEMVQDYIKSFVLTKHTSVDYKHTALFLVEKSNLSTEYKYKIACYFCLKKKVYELVVKLPLEYVNKFLRSSTEVTRLLTLWYFCAQKQTASFNKLLFKLKANKKETNEEYLMLWAIRTKNEIAVQFIYEIFFGKSCYHRLHEFIKYALLNGLNNIVCYLISKMRFCDYDLIKQLCIEDGHNILAMLLNDPRWRSYFFSTSNYVLKYIDKMNFNCYLKTLIYCWIGNKSERNSYNLYLNGFISKFEVSINTRLFYTDNTRVLNLIVELENRKNLNALLTVESKEDIATVSNIGILREIGTELILAKKTQILNRFIKDLFNGQEEEENFKKNYFQKTNFKICSMLILKERFQDLEEYLNTFNEGNSISPYELVIPYLRNGNIIGRVFLSTKKETNVLDAVDRVLRWCFAGNQTFINTCKGQLFQQYSQGYRSCLKSLDSLIQKLKAPNKQNDLIELVQWAYPNDHRLQDIAFIRNSIYE